MLLCFVYHEGRRLQVSSLTLIRLMLSKAMIHHFIMSFPEYPQGGKPSNVVVSAQVHLFGAINLHTMHAIAMLAEATVVQAAALHVLHLSID